MSQGQQSGVTHVTTRAKARFMRGSLFSRLAVSYGAVVLFDALLFVVIAAHFTGLDHPTPGSLHTVAQLQRYQDRLDQSLIRALMLSTVISLLVGGIATIVFTRLLLDPLQRLGASARRLSEGHYGEQIALPRQRELTDLATDLNMLASRLADVETRRARLVSDLAHELRTPLTIIEGQLVGASDGLYEFDGKLLDSVREELDRLRRLTEDLSGLSRAEENAYTLITSPTDLSILTIELADRLRPQFTTRCIRLTTVVSGPACADIDPGRMTQVLSNLLLNALAATPEHGQVTATVSETPDLITIKVSDTGRGIAAGDIARIFDRFERVAPATEEADAAGSGIGLTIARALTHAHGGTLTADSGGVGLGATFTVALPSVAAQKDQRP